MSIEVYEIVEKQVVHGMSPDSMSRTKEDHEPNDMFHVYNGQARGSPPVRRDEAFIGPESHPMAAEQHWLFQLENCI
jgi:hypothetical protein